MDSMQSTGMAAAFITILILDFKGDFVDVASRLGRDRWSHFSTADGLRVGIGPPANCRDHVSWINQFTKIIAAHCDLKYSEATLASVIRIAVNLLNQGQDHIRAWPSLLLIEQLIETLPTQLIAKKDSYRDALLQKISSLHRTSGNLFEAEWGFDVCEHLIKPKRCAVIDCTQLSDLQAQVLANLLALQIMFPRLVLRQVKQGTDFALVIDESDPIISYDASIVYPEGYSEIGRLVKQGRQFGVMGAFGVSFLGRCSQFISSNVSYPIILTQTDPDALAEAGRILLEPDSRQLIASLKCGQGIYREAMGPVRYPMLIQTDHVPPSDMPRPDKFDPHTYTGARRIDDIPGLRERLQQLTGQYRAAANRQNQFKKANSLTKNERAFLDHLSMNESDPVHIHFKRMQNPSAATQKSILNKLEKLGLIAVQQIRTSRSAIRFCCLSDKGWEYLNKTPPKHRLRGDPAHTCITRIKQRYDLEHGAEESTCEAQVPGSSGFTDVLSRRNGKYFCSEIVIGCFSNIVSHVRSCFCESKLIGTLTFVTCLKSDHDKIRDAISADTELVFFLNRIEFITVDELLKEVYKK